jgi:hypothetical protein
MDSESLLLEVDTRSSSLCFTASILEAKLGEVWEDLKSRFGVQDNLLE